MITEVKLRSTDRNLFGIVVEQNSKTGFLSVSHLMSAYENLAIKEGYVVKSISEILRYDKVQERILSY